MSLILYHYFQVLGFCLPRDADDNLYVAMVTELGEAVDLIKLLQMSWEERLRVRHVDSFPRTQCLCCFSFSPPSPLSLSLSLSLSLLYLSLFSLHLIFLFRMYNRQLFFSFLVLSFMFFLTFFFAYCSCFSLKV